MQSNGISPNRVASMTSFKKSNEDYDEAANQYSSLVDNAILEQSELSPRPA